MTFLAQELGTSRVSGLCPSSL